MSQPLSLIKNFAITHQPLRTILAIVVMMLYLLPTLTADLWHRPDPVPPWEVAPSMRFASANVTATSLMQPDVCGSCLITHGLYQMIDTLLAAPAFPCAGTVWIPPPVFTCETAVLAEAGRSPPVALV